MFVKAKRGGWDEFFARPALGVELDAAELRATGPERPVDFDLGARKPAARRRAK
ncbi:hypothetical protein [Nevskia soli]|uniref:hypothetical protein n=1 Tax=Nevskia soli TaxID=418856 RepID=UPI0012F71C71|nr:hypothetical protein [Nevskia soli]